MRTLIAVLMLGGLAATANAADCPTEDEVRASLTKWHTDYNMEESHRDLWNIKGVSGFEFGPMQFGKVVSRDMGDDGEQKVCPVRVDYSYVIENEDGTTDPYKETGKTHYFYQNSFNEWVSKWGR